MNTKKVLADLYSLESYKIKLGIENTQNLLEKVGNPHKELKCIHVAGTNGKGSVCSMIFYILKEAGYKVGLYTSPHLRRFNERIRINEHLITNKEIVKYFFRLKPYITNQNFFEVTTSMAFLYFYEKNVDFVVLEVGLGGRLDATNVITPLVSVITNVGLEHTNLLGNSIEKIAFEKAGIIKKNIPVVTGTHGRALEVIKKLSKEKNAKLFLAGKFKNINFSFLNGEFQKENANTSLTTINILKKICSIKLNNQQIKNGIKKTKWAGRLQFLSKNVLVDCAHNPTGFEVLKKELFKIKNYRNKTQGIKPIIFNKFIFVLGIQNDKNITTILSILNPLVSKIIFTKSKNEKASEPVYLLDKFNKINKNNKIKNTNKIKTKIIKNPAKALNYAKKIAGKQELVVVTGSIYLVGEILTRSKYP